MFVARPVVGVGANQFGFYSCAGPGWYPHSTILQVLAELGVIGGALYFWMIWEVLRRSLARIRRPQDSSNRLDANWIFAFFVLQLITSQFFGSYLLSAAFYFAIGLAASFSNKAHEEPNDI